MIRLSVLLCLVTSCLAHWVDPDWNENNINAGVKYPQLPRSYPLTVLSSSNQNRDPTNTPTWDFTPSITTQFDPTGSPASVGDITTRAHPRYRVDTTTPPSSSATQSPTKSTTTAPSTTSRTPPTTPPSQCTGVFSCADCNTAQVCRPTPSGLVRAYTLPCPKSTPYCDYSSGTCTTVPDSRCGSQDSTFICSDEGYFPDPTNCSVYHACNNYQSQKFQCAEGQVYDPLGTECTSTTTCNFNVACKGFSEVKLPMGNTHFYAYCSNSQPLIVSRCPGEYRLNSTSQVCEPICQNDGLMADLEDCTKFYKCFTINPTGSMLIPMRKHMPCPQGEAFEPTAYQCIPKAMTNCTMSSYM